MYHEDDQAAHVADSHELRETEDERRENEFIVWQAAQAAHVAHVADEVRSERHRAARIFRAFLAEVDATPFSVHEVYRDLCEAASIAIPLLESEARGE